MKKQPDPKELMKRSEEKKKMAAQQERLGKAQVKNKVKPGSTGIIMSRERLGENVPVGAERLKIAKDMRLSSKLDSLQSVRVKNKMELDDKVKTAEKLYKNNPSKVYSDAVASAKAKRAAANKIKPKK